MMYRLFDLNIKIKEKYPETKIMLEKYRSEQSADADITIEISDTEIAREKAHDATHGNSYHEMICIFRHIAEEMLDFDGLFVHSAVIEADKNGYMLTGRSGAGKSTLAINWTKYLDNARVINGDKPILRFFPGGIYAYGSPWCGTEGLNVNGRVKIRSAGFVVQSKMNFVEDINSGEVFKRLLNQTVMPQNAQRKLKYFELLDRLIKEIPFCKINCDISENAVTASYSYMKKLSEK